MADEGLPPIEDMQGSSSGARRSMSQALAVALTLIGHTVVWVSPRRIGHSLKRQSKTAADGGSPQPNRRFGNGGAG